MKLIFFRRKKCVKVGPKSNGCHFQHEEKVLIGRLMMSIGRFKLVLVLMKMNDAMVAL